MGRSAKDLRRSLAPVTGVPAGNDAALLRAAVPGQVPHALADTIKTRGQQLRAGIPTIHKGPTLP